jgi:hypothetical protein
MRLNRPQVAATDREPMAGVARRRNRLGAGVIRVLSVTAVAAATCSLWAGVASAATAHTTKHATKTSVSVSPKTAYTRSSVKLSATVRGSGSRPTGTVTFYSGTKKLCHGTLSRGSTHCSAKFSDPATKTITGKYSGNSSHKASSGTAKLKVINRPAPAKSATTTTITNTDPGTVAVSNTNGYAIDVTVTGGSDATGTAVVAPIPPSPAGLPAADTCTAKITAGKGSCTVHPNLYGIIYYGATYSGNATHKGSTYTGPFALEVQNVTSTTAGPATAAAGTVTLNADVYAMGANITDGMGSAAFYVGTSPTATPTLVTACAAQALTTFNASDDNVATCSDTLAKGTYYITAKFSGDDVNEASNSEPTEIVVS